MDISDRRAQLLITQLNKLLDPLSLRAYLVKKSKYGKVASKSGAWGFTSEFVADYGTQDDVQAIVDLFTAIGINDELEAGRFLLKFDKFVP